MHRFLKGNGPFGYMQTCLFLALQSVFNDVAQLTGGIHRFGLYLILMRIAPSSLQSLTADFISAVGNANPSAF